MLCIIMLLKYEVCSLYLVHFVFCWISVYKPAARNVNKLLSKPLGILFTVLWSTSFVILLIKKLHINVSVYVHTLEPLHKVLLLWLYRGRSGWSRGNALCPYSGCAQFESRLGHRLSWDFPSIPLISWGKCWVNISIRPRSLPSKFIPVHQHQ
jgi:hypothetical protein